MGFHTTSKSRLLLLCLFGLHSLFDAFVPTAISLRSCVVPLSPESNRNLQKQKSSIVVNDNDDGITKVRIKSDSTNAKYTESAQNIKIVLTVEATVSNFNHSSQLACINIWGSDKTQTEECFELLDTNIIWNIELPNLERPIYANAFVRSKISNHVLSMDTTEVVLPCDDMTEMSECSMNSGISNELGVDIFIMSKDRPFEVEALLDSIHRLCVRWNQITVLHLGTTKCTADGYQMCASRYPHVKFVEQSSNRFRNQLLSLISQSNASHVMPMVGEMIFVRPFDFKKAAAELERISPYATYHARLGTQLELYGILKAMFGNMFSQSSSFTDEVHLFDTTLVQQNFCHGGLSSLAKEEWVLNDFWWIHHLGGPILKKSHLLDVWTDIYFSHPGNLEVNWGYVARSRTGALHLMPKLSVLVSNDYALPTRIDHVAQANNSEKASWDSFSERECILYNSKCLPDVQRLISLAETDSSFPKYVRTYNDLFHHCRS